MKSAGAADGWILFHISPSGKIFHNPKDYFISQKRYFITHYASKNSLKFSEFLSSYSESAVNGKYLPRYKRRTVRS